MPGVRDLFHSFPLRRVRRQLSPVVPFRQLFSFVQPVMGRSRHREFGDGYLAVDGNDDELNESESSNNRRGSDSDADADDDEFRFGVKTSPRRIGEALGRACPSIFELNGNAGTKTAERAGKGADGSDDVTRLKRADSDGDGPGFGSREYFHERARKCCTRKTLTEKVPVVSWLPRYNAEDFVGDLIAGITVGFTVIPQSIAYAELAHLPTQYGLYASFIGPFLYILFGTTKEVTIGPTAVMSLMTATYVASHGPAYAVILCFLSGIICMLMGLLKLGVVVQLISTPVTAGFASAAAVIIACSQVKSLLGLKGIHGEKLAEMLSGVFSKIHETNYYDMGMGLVGIASLILLKNMKDINFDRRIRNPRTLKIVEKTIWVISTARNAILVIVGGLVATYANKGHAKPLFSQTDTVVAGLPSFSLPPFYIPAEGTPPDAENGTMGGHDGGDYSPAQNFLEILSEAGSSVIIIPLIGILELMAICKTFAKGKPVDANQEMIALGISQFAGSFFQSMPVTGSFTRCAVNGASGVRTPLGGAYTGIIVLLSLGFLTPYFECIPKAALAAIIVNAMIYMVEYEEAVHIWRTKKVDLVPLSVTFIACIGLGLEFGILIGVAVNIVMLVVYSALPRIGVSKMKLADDRDVVVLTPDRSLHFPGVETIRNALSKKAFTNRDATIVVDCSSVADVDFSAIKGLASLNAGLKERGQRLVFVNVRKSVARIIRGFDHESEIEIYEFSSQAWIAAGHGFGEDQSSTTSVIIPVENGKDGSHS